MNTDDYEQPVGERPELDLSYTHRDGRHVPIRLVGPTQAEMQEWYRGYDEMVRRVTEGFDAGTMTVAQGREALGLPAAWPDAEYVLAAQENTRRAMADIDALARAEAASFTDALMHRYRPRTRDLALLALSLAALIAVLVFILGRAVGVL